MYICRTVNVVWQFSESRPTFSTAVIPAKSRAESKGGAWGAPHHIYLKALVVLFRLI